MLQDHCNSCSEAVILLLGDGQNKPKVVAWKDRQLNHSALFPNLLLLVVGDTRYCLLPDHLNAVDLEVCQLAHKPVHSLLIHTFFAVHLIPLRRCRAWAL